MNDPTQAGKNFPKGINPIPPQGFLEFLGLEKQAAMVISNSGTVVVECAILGIICLIICQNNFL